MNAIALFNTLILAHSESPGLTMGGWTMMLGSIGLVTTLLAFCICRIFSDAAPSEHHHAPLDIDTDDTIGY